MTPTYQGSNPHVAQGTSLAALGKSLVKSAAHTQPDSIPRRSSGVR